MSITPERAAQIENEQSFIKEQISQVVIALNNNTEKVGEMLLEMKERDVREEYREKEYEAMSDRVLFVDAKIDEYIKVKQPIIEWATRRKEFYDSLWGSIRSTWGKMIAVFVIAGVAMALGLDLSAIKG